MTIRRMKKILALSALLLVALPVVASAQMSRVEGMALQGDFIKDWSAIFSYPSQVSNVGNLVYGELGNTSPSVITLDRSVGAVIGNMWEGRLGTWAVHLREQTPQLGQGDASSAPSPGLDGSDPNTHSMESFDLMWGKKFGTTSLGLRLNRSFGGLEVNDPTTLIGKLEYDFTLPGSSNLHRNVVGFGGGIGFEMNPTTNVEAGILYQRRKFSIEDSTGAVLAKEDGPATYQVAGRIMWQWQPNIMVVPVVKYYSYDLSFRAGTAVDDNSLKGWQFGAAANWALGSNDLFVWGATFAQNKLKSVNATAAGQFGAVSEETETYAPQVFAALETHVNSWLTLRFGANKGAWYTIEDQNSTVPNNIKFKGSDFNMHLGAGVKVGNLQLDAILADDFPNNLPYFISGNQTSDMFTKVTATYPF
jgi:hypothetical protein